MHIIGGELQSTELLSIVIFSEGNVVILTSLNQIKTAAHTVEEIKYIKKDFNKNNPNFASRIGFLLLQDCPTPEEKLASVPVNETYHLIGKTFCNCFELLLIVLVTFFFLFVLCLVLFVPFHSHVVALFRKICYRNGWMNGFDAGERKKTRLSMSETVYLC